MSYTVKKLSELSGVSIRTLHFYEEAGLLKPAYYGSNGYRYYKEKELLQLQQILFFKELGFTIKEIQKVVGKSDFDQLAALYSHKKALRLEYEKIGKLMTTVDATIEHLKGQKKMKDEEIFNGFLVTKGKGNESYFEAEEIVLKSVKHPTTHKQKQSYYDQIIERAHAIFQGLKESLEKGEGPSSDSAQKMIEKHHKLTSEIHNATKKVYKALADLYVEHPSFKQQLDPFHPELASYMSKAMHLFADRNLL